MSHAHLCLHVHTVGDQIDGRPVDGIIKCTLSPEESTGLLPFFNFTTLCVLRSHGIHSTLQNQNASFSAREVEYGPASTDFHEFSDIPKRLPRLPDTVFTMFSVRVLPNSHIRDFGPGPNICATKSYADS